jgi:ferric-dicitrate binding protein FerR (iron transport regulator)
MGAAAVCLFGAIGWFCRESETIAEILECSGDVRRDWFDRQGQWTSVSGSEKFVIGDGLRTQESASAVLKLDKSSLLHVKEKTQIRFRSEIARPNARKVVVEKGEVEFRLGEASMDLITDLGVAKLEPNSKIAVKRTDEGVSYRVLVGRASFDSGDVEPKIVGPGDDFLIRFGTALLEVPDEKDTSSAKIEDGDIESAGMDAVETGEEEGVLFRAKGRGIVARQQGQTKWVAVSEGSGHLPAASTVRLPADSAMELPRGEDRVTLFGPGEFRLVGDGETVAQSVSGRMSLEAKNNAVAVLVPGGKIIALSEPEGGTTARISVNKKLTSVDVQRGEVQTSFTDGKSERVLGGQRVQMPNVEEETVDPVGFDTGPGRVDFAVVAGESFVVHAAKPPVALSIRFGEKCPGAGVVQIVGKKTRPSKGNGKAHVSMSLGHSRYQLRCLDEEAGLLGETVAEGKVLVVRDAGIASLPRRAPESFVDADGRRYQIMYQNLLPKVTVRWPKAPAAPAYRLLVSSAGREQESIPLAAPQHTFSSGELKEGDHFFQFEQMGSSVASKKISLQIRFDNAAPKASVKQPADGSFTPGQEVDVEGVTEPGWKVSVDSKEIEQDSSHRFLGKAQTLAQYDGIALRLTHPQRGVHYYLRRGRIGNER